MPHKVELTLNNGQLVLSDTAVVVHSIGTNLKISWVIKDTGIESFQIVGKNPDVPDPFTHRPNGHQSTDQDLTVRLWHGRTDWYYNIIWTDKATHQQHTYDPKISIYPTVGLSSGLFILIAFTIAALIRLRFFWKQKGVRSFELAS